MAWPDRVFDCGMSSDTGSLAVTSPGARLTAVGMAEPEQAREHVLDLP